MYYIYKCIKSNARFTLITSHWTSTFAQFIWFHCIFGAVFRSIRRRFCFFFLFLLVCRCCCCCFFGGHLLFHWPHTQFYLWVPMLCLISWGMIWWNWPLRSLSFMIARSDGWVGASSIRVILYVCIAHLVSFSLILVFRSILFSYSGGPMSYLKSSADFNILSVILTEFCGTAARSCIFLGSSNQIGDYYYAWRLFVSAWRKYYYFVPFVYNRFDVFYPIDCPSLFKYQN